MTDEKRNALPWLHVYAQNAWHDDVQIEGTRSALMNLRAALDECLAKGLDSHAAAITSDGEGYSIVVSIRTVEALDKQPLPYIDPMAGGPPDWTGEGR